MRKHLIWTLEVHDVLEANQYMIKNFMQWYIKTRCVKKGRKVINLDDIKEMILQVPRGYSNNIKTATELLD